MLFEFQKYLQPTSYFLLRNGEGNYIFPDVSKLPQDILKDLFLDDGYQSPVARDYDKAWQAIMRGYTGKITKLTKIDPVPLADNYRFVANYFAKPWLVYIALLRILTFHNPVKELLAFFKVIKIRRKSLVYPVDQPKFMASEVNEAEDQALVSVVIPTLNRYDYLKQGLLDLEQQDYMHLEILIVDQSDNFEPSFYQQFKLPLQVIRQEEKALWLARNTAIKQAKGDYLLLFDDDSRVESDWVRSHLEALNYFQAQISSGVSISTVGAPVPQHYAYYRISDQLDTGNVMLKREVFKKIGLFDRQFEKQRMGDGEFGLRAYLEGFKNISNPKAQRLHLKLGTGGLREMGSWDAFRPKKWSSPRPIPSVLYFFRKYFGDQQARYALLKNIPSSVVPYRFKGNKVLLLLGVVLSVLILPWILWQVYKSWSLSTQKLQEGPLIDYLK